jgi:ATP-dependent DNA helicase RecG
MLDLAKKIGVDHKTIKRDIAKLKNLGLLKRIGPAKGGHWEVS